MVESVAIRSKSSVYGEQPRSLHINWMKHDVTKIDEENFDPNVMRNKNHSSQKSLSPLRLKLQAKGEKVLKKRQ